MKIIPARRLNGRLSLPGDKSISHRAAIISALAKGTSRISNFSSSADCAATLSCLERLGVAVEVAGTNVEISGGTLRRPDNDLYCGNSGSTIRMLTGVLAGQNFSSTLTGDHSLSRRPMERVIEPLTKMGAEVRSNEGKPPLTVRGVSPLLPVRYELPVASAQVKSCVLLAGLNAAGPTEVIEKHETRDHTERMLNWFGVPVLSNMIDGQVCSILAIEHPVSFVARDLSVPGDVSSAAFLIAAAALLPGSDLEIVDVGLNPTRTAFLRWLRSVVFRLEVIEETVECNEPRGNIHVHEIREAGPAETGTVQLLRGGLIAELIDELPLVAVVGSQISGGIEIRDAGELRHKESDRIKTTIVNLRAMGADVEEFADGLRVNGPTRLRGARIDSFGDHRIAMAFTVAALLAEGESEIVDDDCVGVSFPEFFNVLSSLTEG